jgi:hypothetical protein
MSLIAAKGIHDHPKYKLGAVLDPEAKKNCKVHWDKFLVSDISVPTTYDYDATIQAPPIPDSMWGNDQYGDCECAGRANYLLRLQRNQTGENIPLTDDDVIALYKSITGCVSPGDNNDTGMSTLQNLQSWKAGWTLDKAWSGSTVASDRTFGLDAYGYVDYTNQELIRAAIYLFGGVIWGVNLPQTAQEQTQNGGPWTVTGNPNDPNDPAYPGSWGGHCVYSKRFDADNIYVLTWDEEIQVTNEWIATYAMESYSVIDSLDAWLAANGQNLNVQALLQEMQSEGIQVQQ